MKIINSNNSSIDAKTVKNILINGKIEQFKLLVNLKYIDLIGIDALCPWYLFRSALNGTINPILMSLLFLNSITVNPFEIEDITNKVISDQVSMLCDLFISKLNEMNYLYNWNIRHRILEVVFDLGDLEVIELCCHKLFDEYNVQSNVLYGLLYKSVDQSNLELFKWVLTKFDQTELDRHPNTMLYYLGVSRENNSVKISDWIETNYLKFT